MTTSPSDAIATLSEKEKQTLRLMVRGHDAKSIARALGLSVHTINERLRDARRKLAVSSSREAARMLLATEQDRAAPAPDLSGDTQIGADPPHVLADGDAGRTDSRPRIVKGVFFMSIVIGLFALAIAPVATPPASVPAAAQDAPDPAIVDSARRFLALVDRGQWDASYALTGSAFRKLNSEEVWARVSQEVRPPLGAVVSRSLLSLEELPAPPAGYQVVKFRTDFANRRQAVETVSLEREDGAWRVVGVTIG